MKEFRHLYTGGYEGAIRLLTQRREMGLKTAIFTPNAEMLSLCSRNEDLKKLLLKGDILLPDGVGIYLAAFLSENKISERTNGIDFAEKLMGHHEENTKIFLLGAAPGISEKAAKELKRIYPSITISGCHHGFFTDDEAVVQKINESDANTLFVCLGFPRQEAWIVDNLSYLKNIDLAIGLGGSLDIWAGKSRRAPRILRKTGLEWLFRIFVSPERIKRFPSLLHFIVLYLKGKIAL